MAKLKAPLLSFSASGKIADALVYFTWKGLEVVRQYVVPSNPKSTLQTTQRGYLTDAVAAIHVAQGEATQPLDENDTTAYAALGSTHATPRTWWNEICKIWLDTKVAAKVACIYSGGTHSDLSKDDFRPSLYLNEETGSTLAAGKFYLGTSKTALVTSKAADVNAAVDVGLDPANGFDGLVAGTKYYWQFRPDSGDGCEGAVSGIYSGVAT